MQIEVFSDVVCPFCYIGKRRLEEALDGFDHADGVTVTYRSFQLDPTSPATSELSLEEMLAQKYGRTLEQARAMNDRVSDMAATAGLDFQLQDAHPANTFRAHRLLHFAATRDLGNALTERLMRGYFSEGVRIGDRDELLRLAIEVGPSLKGEDVVRTLTRIAAARGKPRTVKSDNGSEFISKAMDRWAYENAVELDFSRPGKPTDNAKVESFNGRLRSECLNAHWFLSLDDAKRKIEAWRQYYNEIRPHSALNWATPAEYARRMRKAAQSHASTEPEIPKSGRD